MNKNSSIIISGIGIWILLIMVFTGNSPSNYHTVFPFFCILLWLMIAYEKHRVKNENK